jgi:hypothetical protein
MVQSYIYNLADIQQKIDSVGYSYDLYLTDEIKTIITNLDKTVMDLTPTLGDVTIGSNNSGLIPPRTRIYDNTVARRGGDRGDRSYRKKSGHSPHDTIESWIAVRNFKPTKMEVKEGIEKNINEIRVVLNKITNKNYQVQMETILGLIDKNIESFKDMETGDGVVEEETPEYMMNKIGNFIFDISSTNKFYSELYADLYKVLVERDRVFLDILNTYLESYKEITMLPFVDSSVNYDAYCEYTKSNERRRAAIHFFILLMKRDVLDPCHMIELAQMYLRVIKDNLNEASYVNQIDEYTELIFIIMTVGKDSFIGNAGFSELCSEMDIIAGYKMKEYAGISSRTLFKYRDLVKALKTT